VYLVLRKVSIPKESLLNTFSRLFYNFTEYLYIFLFYVIGVDYFYCTEKYQNTSTHEIARVLKPLKTVTKSMQ